MPRFKPDLTKVRSSIRVFDRGDYQLKVTKSNPFIDEEKDDGKGGTKQNAGCIYNLEMVGKLGPDGQPTEEFRGETVSQQRCFVHNEGGWSMTKQFLMAVLGYARDEEEKFDAEWAANADLSLDGEGEEVEAGKSWEDPVGKNVNVTLDKRMYEGREFQDFKGWTPANQKRGGRRSR